MLAQSYSRNRSWSLAAVVVGTLIAAVLGAFVLWAFTAPDDFIEQARRNVGHRSPVALLPYALIGMPVVLGAVVYHALLLLDRKPLLTLSPAGLFYRDWKAGVVPWSDVENCVVVVLERERALASSKFRRYLLEIRLRDPLPYLEKAHGRAEFSDGFARSYFRIPMRAIDADRGELWRSIMGRVAGPGEVAPSGPRMETVQVP